MLPNSSLKKKKKIRKKKMASNQAPEGVTSVWHICPQQLWEDSLEKGTYTPEAYPQDGFVHGCSFAKELVPIGNRFYKSDPRPYVLLRMPLEKLAKADLRFEAPMPVAGQASHVSEGLFPHIYEPIAKEFVTEVVSLKRLEDGTFLPVDIQD